MFEYLFSNFDTTRRFFYFLLILLFSTERNGTKRWYCDVAENVYGTGQAAWWQTMANACIMTVALVT